MERRDSIKSVIVGSITGGLLLAGCNPASDQKAEQKEDEDGLYGRTDKEKARDTVLKAAAFFSEHELTTIKVLCDFILPATATAISASAAKVPEFIAFIVQDMPRHQLPLRGGLMWLDHRSTSIYEHPFIEISADQQKKLIDEIAYPEEAAPEVKAGAEFFNRLRNLVLTGYYTTRAGIDDLGYKGNVPNTWEGVPEDVLAKHGLAYEPEWAAKCINQEKRTVIAKWDEQGNLIY